MERMTCQLGGLKFAGADAKAGQFSGYGAVFGNVDSYGDVIEPGAFSAWLSDVKSGKQPWPSMLSQHGGWALTADDLTPVGVFTGLSEDGTGLAFDGQLADTTRAQDLYKLMKMEPRPAINGMSIGYVAKEWEPRSKPEDPRRKLKRIDVMEISLVTFPANPKALVTGVKSGGATEREFEHFLMRDAGMSRSDARIVINRGFKTLLAMQDAGGGGSHELDEIAALLKRAA